jgi:poly-beta-1,6-N-acetyl-D-glucosamine synthase
MKTIFILSILFIFYTYLGYFFWLFIRSIIFPKPIRKKHDTKLPFISIVIASKNEEKNIGNRIQNILETQYPEKSLEIIVVSDGSEDNTNRIIKECSKNDKKINLIAYHPSRGKPFALNTGIKQAKGDIIIFTDSRQRFHSMALTELVANFNDPDVGCVSGELIFQESHDSAIQKEMGAYWHYEKMVRKMESRAGSAAGATGAVYAIRKALYKTIPEETILDDVLIPMNIVMQGYRCVFDPSARAYDSVSKDIESEITRKIRTLAGNWQLLKIAPELLLPHKNALWWGFLSHKIFRLIVPFMMISLFIVNFFLKEPFYIFTLICQIFFYGLALYAFINPGVRNKKPVNLIYFFVNMNYAALMGAWYFFSGNIARTWKKAG